MSENGTDAKSRAARISSNRENFEGGCFVLWVGLVLAGILVTCVFYFGK
ncbi:MAG: hypothetical protein ACI9LY_004021 [Arenicella sp.]